MQVLMPAEAPLSIDGAPFKCRHSLLEHPALSLENVAQVVQRLPPEQVFFSSGKLQKSTDFDRAHKEHATGRSLKDTVENMLTSDSYIMLRSPEQDPSFAELFGALKADVEALMREQGLGAQAHDPMLYMFIASPRSLTPFHIDRYSTFLLQFRGRKDVYVYPAHDPRVLQAKDVEAFVVRSGVKTPYDERVDQFATRFEFGPGETLHIPFLAPHYVRNGADDVSISLSIIFNTDVTKRWLDAITMNYMLRKALGRFGYAPSPVGTRPRVDAMKGALSRRIQALRGRAG